MEIGFLILSDSDLECVNHKLQVRVKGHCFTIDETTQTFTNANTRPKK